MSKLDLRSFQQEISERLAAARRSGGEVPRLAFFTAAIGYALPLTEIAEVSPLTDIRSVPGSKPWFMGLTNVRGSVLALTHLGALVHNTPTQRSPHSRVLVLGGQYTRLRCGILVDSVAGLRTLKITTSETSAGDTTSRVGIDPQGIEWKLLEFADLITQTSFFEVCESHESLAA